MASTIRLLAVIEASTITGPAKNLLQFAELARTQAADTVVEVHAAVFQRPGASTLFLETARQRSLPVHVIPEKGRFDRTVVPALAALVRELRPAIVQSHAVKSHFMVRQAGIPPICPWVAFHHGYTTPDLRAQLYNQLDWWSLRAAPRAITVSLPFRDELVRKGVAPDRISVVHNAIDPRWGASFRLPATARALREKLGIPATAKVILLVGRFSGEKDHLTLLSAVAGLRDAGKVAPHLVLVGDGPYRSRIENAIRSLALQDSVTLTGHVPTAEPYYGIADAAVLSSLSEGSPNALLEAMAVGVPVVATRVGGIPEIATDGETALLIEPRDREGMTRALETVLTQTDLAGKLVTQARRIIESRYTPEQRTRRLIDIYCEVAALPLANPV